jgi:hypothetical protein
MAMHDSELERLLRAAARSDQPEPTAPFGFDTRVVAQWRATRSDNGSFSREIAALLRRIAVGAVIVTVVASVGAYWQVSENEDEGEPLTNAYAIADHAIESGVFQ